MLLKDIELKYSAINKAILAHPFISGISNGDLSEEKFIFYLKQDYLFLIEYSRLLGLMVTKASSMSLMMKVSTLLDETLNNEMDLHISFCSKFGISRKEILKTRPAPITMGYTNFLLRIAYENTFAEMLISLFPCQWGYYELGRELHSENTLKNNSKYTAWVDMYISSEYADLAKWIRDLTKNVVMESNKNNLEKIYYTSLCYEFMFWQMSWDMDFGPKILQI